MHLFLYLWHKSCGKCLLIEATAISAVTQAALLKQDQETDWDWISPSFLVTGLSSDSADLGDTVTPRER
jgi:hypothetical protein